MNRPSFTLPKSGGRDAWSPPLPMLPDDPVGSVWSALGEVLDPELPISLVELGIVYGVEYADGVATITITFTATACPCMEFIREDIADRLGAEPWIARVRIEETWDPPWTSERISESGRAKLRSCGVAA